MDKQKKNYFKKILLEKRTGVLKAIEQLKASNMNAQDDWFELPKYSHHIADESSESQEREQHFLFLSREKKYLQQIDRALLEIENGTYGKCKVCNKIINEERLEAVPTTTICYSCKMIQSKKITIN